jgi:hypothetical protein
VIVSSTHIVGGSSLVSQIKQEQADVGYGLKQLTSCVRKVSLHPREDCVHFSFELTHSTAPTLLAVCNVYS